MRRMSAPGFVKVDGKATRTMVDIGWSKPGTVMDRVLRRGYEYTTGRRYSGVIGS